MGRQRNSILILGEGPTEFYYFHSLRDELRGIDIKPDYPKNTSMKELDLKIEQGIADGRTHIFCVIDMDTKDKEPERTQYARLRKKYSAPIIKPRKGIKCEVRFFETHLCTELFFLYYFRYTSRSYSDQEALLKDLNAQCAYEKSEKFFNKIRGLYAYFEKNGGSLADAISRGEQSLREREAGDRNYTYSELGGMIERIKRLTRI